MVRLALGSGRAPQANSRLEEIEAKVDKYGELLPELMDRLERELAAEALAVWEAFSSFCREDMGLSAEKLLQATLRPALEDVEWFKELCERLELEADLKMVEEHREALGARWQRIVERGA